MKNLWSSTGFSPEELNHTKNLDILTRKDTFLNVKLIGSLPQGSIQQIRVHWLLDLMTNPFDMGKLDDFIHLLWTCNLKPGFELMGNPGNFFQTDFKGKQMALFLLTGITPDH